MTNPIGSSPSSHSAATTTAPAPATTRPMGYRFSSAAFDTLGGAGITGASWVFRPAVQTVIFGAVSTLIKRTTNAAGNPIDTPAEEAAVACMSNVIADYGSGVVAGALHALATTFVGLSRLSINSLASYMQPTNGVLLDAIPLGPGSNERLNLDDSITASFTLLAVGRNLTLARNSENLASSLKPNQASSASTYLAGNHFTPLGPGGMLAGGAAMLAASAIAMRRENKLVQVPINQPTAREIFTKLPNHLYSRIRAGIEMESQGSKLSLYMPVVLMQALLPIIAYAMNEKGVNKTTIAATIAGLNAYVHMVRVDNWASLRRSGELTGDQLRAMQATESKWAKGGNSFSSAVGNFRARRLGDDAKVSDARLAADHAGSGIDRAALYRTICAIGTTATAFLCVDQVRAAYVHQDVDPAHGASFEQSLAGVTEDSIHQLVNGQVPWPTAAMHGGFSFAIGMACLYIANHCIKDPIPKPALPAAPAQNAGTGAGHAQIFTTRTVAGFAAGAFAGGGLGVGGLIGAALAVSLRTLKPNRREQAAQGVVQNLDNKAANEATTRVKNTLSADEVANQRGERKEPVLNNEHLIDMPHDAASTISTTSSPSSISPPPPPPPPPSPRSPIFPPTSPYAFDPMALSPSLPPAPDLNVSDFTTVGNSENVQGDSEGKSDHLVKFHTPLKGGFATSPSARDNQATRPKVHLEAPGDSTPLRKTKAEQNLGSASQNQSRAARLKTPTSPPSNPTNTHYPPPSPQPKPAIKR